MTTATYNNQRRRKGKKIYTQAEKEQFKERDQERRQELQDKIQQAIAAIQESEAFKRWLKVSAKFHRYSFNNTLLIYQQKPDATHVAGFDTWRKLGRTPRKGSAIFIFAPMPFSTTKQNERGEEEERAGIRFKVAWVFDYADTEGEPLPEPPAPALLTGDDGQQLYAALSAWATEQGITVTNDDPDAAETSARGYYRPGKKGAAPTIWVRPGPANQMAKTVIHELGHHLDPQLYETGRDEQETTAEATAFMVCDHFGIDTGCYTFPYIAQWTAAAGGAEILSRTMTRVHQIARLLIDAAETRIKNPEPPTPSDDSQAGRESEDSRPELDQAEHQAAPAPAPQRANAAAAGQLRQLAEAMTKAIQEKRNPAIAGQRVTHRRARIADGMARDAERLEHVQSVLYALAEGHDAGSVPAALAGIRSRAQVETIITYSRWPEASWSAEEAARLKKANITRANFPAVLEALAAQVQPKPAEPDHVAQLRELERQLIGCSIPGFFPTPRTIGEQMLDAANIWPGARVLEPSAGNGQLADLIRERHPDAQLVTLEINHTLREILSAKGHSVIGDDFLAHAGSYDFILMNPPFEDGQDARHVMHAYTLLAPGGRLVSIMGEGAFFHKHRQAQAFREWLEQVGGEAERLPAGSFNTGIRPTSVATRMVVISKP